MNARRYPLMSNEPTITKHDDGTLSIADCDPDETYPAVGAVLLRMVDDYNAAVLRRCGTCRYWRRLEGIYAPLDSTSGDSFPEWGYCEFIMHGGPWEEWVAEPLPASELAYTYDGSDYKSGLNTKASFGCVEHAATPLEDQ